MKYCFFILTILTMLDMSNDNSPNAHPNPSEKKNKQKEEIVYVNS